MSPTALLRFEGAAVLIAAGIGYSLLGMPWWLFFVLLLVPDVFIVGYLAGPRRGALAYNAGHTYVLPMGLGAVAWGTGSGLVGAVALIWAAHIGMDRALGYGLKHPSGFHNTHLRHPDADRRSSSAGRGAESGTDIGSTSPHARPWSDHVVL